MKRNARCYFIKIAANFEPCDLLTWIVRNLSNKLERQKAWSTHSWKRAGVPQGCAWLYEVGVHGPKHKQSDSIFYDVFGLHNVRASNAECLPPPKEMEETTNSKYRNAQKMQTQNQICPFRHMGR